MIAEVKRLGMARLGLTLLIALLPTVGVTQSASAQDPPSSGTSVRNGSILGLVVDDRGEAIAGASVTVTGPSGRSHELETSAHGSFLVPHVASGRYKISVAAKGFAPRTLTDVVVTSNRNAHVQIEVATAKRRQEVVISSTDRSTSDAPDRESVAQPDETAIDKHPEARNLPRPSVQEGAPSVLDDTRPKEPSPIKPPAREEPRRAVAGRPHEEPSPVPSAAQGAARPAVANTSHDEPSPRQPPVQEEPQRAVADRSHEEPSPVPSAGQGAAQPAVANTSHDEPGPTKPPAQEEPQPPVANARLEEPRPAPAPDPGEVPSVPAQALPLTSGPAGSILGSVVDESGGGIEGARVTVTDDIGRSRDVETSLDGSFHLSRVGSGKYEISVTAQHFGPQTLSDVVVESDGNAHVEMQLQIESHKEEITVLAANRMNSGALFRGSTMVLDENAIAMLPDGPSLEAMLNAMALRTTGLLGAEIRVNGFKGNRTPPKSAIREIRINNNPFSTEYAKHGLGRVEILTKPGADKFHGRLHMAFGDDALNSRNPFANERAPFQQRNYSGDLSGPIIKDRVGFFADFRREENDSNVVVNATVVDDQSQLIKSYNQVVQTPRRGGGVTVRSDFQLHPKHTAIAQYSDSWKRTLNSGVGELELPSRAQILTNRTRSVQLTETAVLSGRMINETRVQLLRERVARTGDNSIAEIRVPGAFMGGGAELGESFDRSKRLDIENVTSVQVGKHNIKAGVQLMYNRLWIASDRTFGGAYTFGGGLAPRLDERDEIVRGSDGAPELEPITTIESYRRTLRFGAMGLTPAAIRELGGGPVQFSLMAGQPQTTLEQYEIGAFLQDDWRLHPKFMLSPGLRVERQNNLSGNLNFAPRIGFAWNAGAGKNPKTVVRGGAGLFYDRIDDRIVLRSRQLDGTRQSQFITSDSAVLDLFPAVPPLEVLSGFATPRSVVQLAPGLRPAYTLHASLSVERQLSKLLGFAATYSDIRSVRLLRSRNINAPRPGSVDASAPWLADRPFPGQGNIFAYESTGFLDSRQVLVNLTYFRDKSASYWVSYTYNDSHTDAEGPSTFPASSYNLRQDYARSSLAPLHTIYWGGWMSAPWGIEVLPLGVWRTGIPFNVTSGFDTNGDSLFTDRPAFATDPNSPGVVVNRYGMFNLNPAPGAVLIPRNYLRGPGFLIANVQVRRTFDFSENGRIIVSIQAQNVFNQTNPGRPVGNLLSPFFGSSVSSAGDWGLGSNQAGNRRIIISITYGF